MRPRARLRRLVLLPLLAAFAASLMPLACGPPVPSLVPLGGVSEPKPEKKRAARAEGKAPTASEPNRGGGEDDIEADDTVAVVSTEADGGAPAKTAAETAAARAAAEAAPPAKIDGEYVGNDTAVYRMDGMPDRTERDPKARTLVRTPDDTTAEIVILDSSTGKEICTLEGERKGNAVTLRAGQKCFEQDGEGASSSASLKAGTAAVTADTLVVKLDMDFSLTISGSTVRGSLDYQFDGKRK